MSSFWTDVKVKSIFSDECQLDRYKWCLDNIGSGGINWKWFTEWSTHDNDDCITKYCFRYDEDAVLFALRWA